MPLQKRLDLIEQYRRYHTQIRRPGRTLEIQILPGAVEAHYGRKTKSNR